ncbi:hypothetical protein J5N97_001860 [Dioscorea zingiberensis]|uniref:non-specific serine/threonine protein kinase n=1 Tax=Dioscorea zingiberensis TaxID=325984 RepID=A0A9D5H231_9LILI|nr:hypothetical protein J5N97_001860 [Dioscorea zingiberensis]
MAVEEMENGENRPEGSPPRNSRKNGHKLDVYNEVLRRLKESDCPDARSASFDEDLWAHFNRLPARYAIDVNVERVENVLTHKRYVLIMSYIEVILLIPNAQEKEDAQCCSSLHHPLAFGTSVNLEALVLESNNVHQAQDGDSYRGTYYSQDVAIKVLKPERLNEDMQHEFAQEVYIMRKVRHRNVVQFIGACTRPPSLCIVTEFMSGGSIYDFLHKQKGVFKLPALLRVAIDVSKGMNYLHQNNIIHRDLKAANLLMDENEVVKVADFGVARVKAQSGVMTAETGTYRWMAPEVIEHKPYDHKADVFSFAIVLWELLTGKLPYEFITPLQAAVGVVQKGLRPSIPKHTHPKLTELLKKCWQQDPSLRPDFSEILEILQIIIKEIEDRPKEKSGGFLSVLKRSH